MKKILDACCGSRMFWFDRKNKHTVYMDIRKEVHTLCDGRTLNITPDILADFRNIPFCDNMFYLVVFDPPHLCNVGKSSWMSKKYGYLGENWRNDIKKGFSECWRVLRPKGTLIFKWNEEQVKLNEILAILPQSPLFGNRRAKTHWLVFFKDL